MENETFELEQCVAYIATNASKQLAENFDHLLRKQGISRVQWIALYYIGKEKTLSQAGLAQHMRIKPSTVTTLIDRMIRDGLIMRTKDPGNRRKVCISLTKEGEVHRKRFMKCGNDYSNAITDGISSDDLENFILVLKKLQENSDSYCIND